jgi:hypothetical protein
MSLLLGLSSDLVLVKRASWGIGVGFDDGGFRIDREIRRPGHTAGVAGG